MNEWSNVPIFGHTDHLASAIDRPSAYGILVDGDGRIALVRTPGGYYLPGGGIEPGELPTQAIIREFREECGLVVELGQWVLRAIDIVSSAAEAAVFAKRSTFADAHIRGTATPLDEDYRLEWWDPKAARPRLKHASHRWAILRFLAHDPLRSRRLD